MMQPPDSGMQEAALRAGPDGFEVQIELCVPGLVIDAREVAGGRVRNTAGVVHPDRERTELGGGAPGKPLEGARFRDIGGDCDRAATECPDRGGHLVDLLLVAGRDDNVGASLCEAHRDAATDSLAGPCHHSDLPSKPELIQNTHRYRFPS